LVVRIEALTQFAVTFVELLPFFGKRFRAAVAAIKLTATDVIAIVADTITLVLLVSACAGAGSRFVVRIFAFTLCAVCFLDVTTAVTTVEIAATVVVVVVTVAVALVLGFSACAFAVGILLLGIFASALLAVICFDRATRD